MKIADVAEFFRGGMYALVSNNPSRLGVRLRRKFFKTNCFIDTSVFISNRDNFACGQRAALYHGTYILNHSGKMTLGNNSHLGALCFVNVCYGNLNIGDDVAIGPGTKLIVYSNHYERGGKVTDGRITKDVRIGNNVFIGANCVILPGANIADNVVVGANSVIRGELEGNSIYAGVPCKKIREGWYA